MLIECILLSGLTMLSVINSAEGVNLSPDDPVSYSRPDLAVIKHISMTFNVDFVNKVLDSVAVIDFLILQDLNELILDISNLDIEYIRAKDGTNLKYITGVILPNYGSRLSVTLPERAKVNETVQIEIKYKTSPKASALIWLNPNQTSGKIHPYLFSQCGPIHARSVIPCQDTPAVKFTYDATVTSPEGFTVLMSALRDEPNGNRTTFRQPKAIPSYLLAIAVGMLEHRTLGPRSKVWTEKEEIEKSAWEFAETEKYLQAAESYCGPYEWTQYDLLVLPPSFLHGGMENPCITFVTPALLAGDRSQVPVIIHEITHSWTGNLVAIKTFEHFWLKESFTVFLERKIGASMLSDPEEAKRSRDFNSLLGLLALSETVNETLGVSSPLTRLVIDLKSVHPDDAFSRIPYEKGSLFLRYIEDLLGGPEVFDGYVRSYIKKFKNKSIDTNQFKNHLIDYFKDNEHINDIDWDTWLYGTGMPSVIPKYDESMVTPVNELVKNILKGTVKPSATDIKSFTSTQIVYLLQLLVESPALQSDTLRKLGQEYGLVRSHNSEIIFRWLRLCIRARDEKYLPDTFEFLNRQGRMAYVRPIYRDLYAWEDVRERAINNFLKNEPYMMHITAYTLRKDLHLN